jgi:hypothetical protein
MKVRQDSQRSVDVDSALVARTAMVCVGSSWAKVGLLQVVHTLYVTAPSDGVGG